MAELFDTLQLGALMLPNRIIMAPMTRSRADAEGAPLDMVAEYYAQRASAGLILSEAIFISPMAKGYVRTPWHGQHRAPCRLAQSHRRRPRQRRSHFSRSSITPGASPCRRCLPGGALPVAPSAIAIKGQNKTDDGPKDFVVPPRARKPTRFPVSPTNSGALRNGRWRTGFDGVEIHGASGYLVHQFLDATINRRDDRYGGSPANRTRFPLEVVDSVCAAVGADRTGIKLSPRIKFNDVQEPDAEDVYPILARELSARQIAYLHGAKQGGYEVHELRKLFKGVYAAGAGFDLEKAEAALQSGAADAIVFGKPFLANPDLARRLRDRLELAQPDQSTVYSGGAKGYVDYPAHT